jgi:acyl-CoA thioester hydrolase
MEKYIHKVNYYETDKMGITHHSNYIRWMEEARIDYFDKNNLGYKQMEDSGIISPVVSVECDYKATTTFDDRIAISVVAEEFKGVKLILRYTMINVENNTLVCEGKSTHCFIDKDGKPIYLKKSHPEVDAQLKDLLGKE